MRGLSFGASVVTKRRREPLYGIMLAALGLFCSMPADHANAAASLYFDVNGVITGYGITNGGTYSWDGANWASTSGGTTTTGNWVAGDFAVFPGGVSGNSYTVTVGQDESMAGLYETVNGVNLTISQAPSTSGDLNITAVGGPIQGFLNGGSSSTLTINAPIVGSGGLEPENGGNIYLNGVYNYSGGTLLGSSSTLTYFNNGSAFGTGTITATLGSATSFAPLLGTAGTTTTIANNWAATQGGVNFATNASTPIVTTGTWNLTGMPTNQAFKLRNNGPISSPLTLSGIISDSGQGITLSGANGGTITFSGANTYTGPTTIGMTGDTAITLVLGAPNTIASSGGVVMAGGTLDPGDFMHTMTSTTLGMTVNSAITFLSGPAEIDFANSYGLTWTGTLNLVGFNGAMDALRFGTDTTGLSSAELADIEFNSDPTTLGTAFLTSTGYLVPEPASMSLLLAGGSLLMARRRRKAA